MYPSGWGYTLSLRRSWVSIYIMTRGVLVYAHDRCPHAYDACEDTRHAYSAWNVCNACDAWLPFGAHALHVMHDNHVDHSSSHVWELTCEKYNDGSVVSLA